jgi:hypothetical protein
MEHRVLMVLKDSLVQLVLREQPGLLVSLAQLVFKEQPGRLVFRERQAQPERQD